MFYASQEKKHGIFFKTAGEINDLYFFVRTENITSVQLTAFGNCSRVQILSDWEYDFSPFNLLFLS